MDKTSSAILNKNVFQYSVILGLSVIVYSVIQHALGMNSNKAMGALTYLILIVVLLFAIKSHRDKYLDGLLTFGQGVKIGFFVSLFGGFIIALFSLYMMKVIDPGIEQELVNVAMESALKQGGNEASLQMAEKITRFLLRPWVFVLSEVFNYALLGSVVSLILSAIFQKKDNSFESAMHNV